MPKPPSTLFDDRVAFALRWYIGQRDAITEASPIHVDSERWQELLPTPTQESDTPLDEYISRGQDLQDELAQVALAEEKLWTRDTGAKWDETSAERIEDLELYWQATCHVTESQPGAWAAEASKNKMAWSAAFISWVVTEARYNVSPDIRGFKPSSLHSNYFVQALRNRESLLPTGGAAPDRYFFLYPPQELADSTTPNRLRLQIGDLVCRDRTDPADSYQSLRTKYVGNTRPAGEASHCDLIAGTANVDGTNYLVSVGGNVSTVSSPKETVGKKYFEVDAAGLVVVDHFNSDGQAVLTRKLFRYDPINAEGDFTEISSGTRKTQMTVFGVISVLPRDLR